MALTTRDQLVAAVAAALDSPFYKASITSVAGFFYSTFRAAAGMPGASSLSTPTTTGAALSSASSGALAVPAYSSGKTTYLAGAQVAGSVVGGVLLCDRLVEYGGLSGTSTSAQTLSSVTLPTRAGTGQGCQIWLDWYTATGSTAVTATVSYTNSAATAGRSGSVSVAASTPANRCLPLSMAAGDVGVQAAASVTLSATTGTAGNFGLTIRKPIQFFAMPVVAIPAFMGYAETALSQIPDDSNSSACLELLVLASTTSTGNIQGMLNLAQG